MRLGVLATHPIQNHAPVFRELAARCDLTVHFAHRQTPEGQAKAGFGVAFDWDVDLLSGFPSVFLENRSPRPGTSGFFGCDTPGIDRAIGDGGFDAFLVMGWNVKSYWQAVRACRRRGIPVLIRGDSQRADRRRLPVRLAKKLLYPRLLQSFDGFCYVGRRNFEYLRGYGAPEGRLYFAPHCVDNAAFAAKAQASFRPRDPSAPKSVLFAGKLIEKKRPLDLIRALALAQNAGCRVQAIFAGSGELEEELRRAAVQNGLSAIFLGFQNQSRMPSIYAAADLLVLPSDHRETWGLVVNEAMACGTPAVVSDAVGCGPDLIEAGRTGASFPLGEVAALDAAIRSVLGRDKSTFRDQLAQKIAAYSPVAAARGILQCSSELCKADRR